MAEARGELELYNQWFTVADADRDGKVSGGEAAQFFLRSGLSQNPTLFKIWQLVAGNGAFLNHQAFYTALKLVSLAQGTLYDTAFTQLDSDGDGWVQGVDCFNVFMQSGLAKDTLRAVWDLVAGSQGQLSRHQFVQALYLVDFAKHGGQLPAQLPPGRFPPSASSLGLDALAHGRAGDIFSAQGADAGPLPPQAHYTPRATTPSAPPPPSTLPHFSDAQLAALPPHERERLARERAAAAEAEAAAHRAEEERAAAAARAAFYTGALAELRLCAGRVARASTEAAQRAEMERAEAARMEAAYAAAYADFSAAHAAHAPLMAALREAEEAKAGLEQRAAALRGALEGVERVDEHWEEAARGEAESLRREIAELEARLERARAANAAAARRREGVLARVEGLRAAAAAAEAGSGEAEAALGEAERSGALEGSRTRAAAIAPAGAREELARHAQGVSAALARVARVYNRLYDAAKAAMVPLPAEALASVRREAAPFAFDALAAAAADDWGRFDDAGARVVQALAPDLRMGGYALTPVAERLEKEDVAEAEERAAGKVADEGTRAGPDAEPEGLLEPARELEEAPAGEASRRSTPHAGSEGAEAAEAPAEAVEVAGAAASPRPGEEEEVKETEDAEGKDEAPTPVPEEGKEEMSAPASPEETSGKASAPASPEEGKKTSAPVSPEEGKKTSAPATPEAPQTEASHGGRAGSAAPEEAEGPQKPDRVNGREALAPKLEQLHALGDDIDRWTSF